MKAATLAPQDIACLHTSGAIHFALRRWNESRYIYKKLTELAPDVPNYWYNRGWACNSAGAFGEAADCMKHCLELRQYDDPVMLLEAAAMLDKADRLAEGLLLVNLALETDEGCDAVKAKAQGGLDYLLGKETSQEFREIIMRAFG